MTNEEWLNHSIEWRKGWHSANADMPYDKNQSEDWKQGYIYALNNPMGGYTAQ